MEANRGSWSRLQIQERTGVRGKSLREALAWLLDRGVLVEEWVVGLGVQRTFRVRG